MAAPSVTYTFANSTTADATQVNTNFNDIINSMTDGLKDFAILTLIVSSTFTANGNVNLGDSSSDDLTITASLASSIPVKTTNSYDIGSATLGLRSVYLGGTSSFTTRVKGSATATYTMTLPPATGAQGQMLRASDASSTLEWANYRAPLNHLFNANFDLWQRSAINLVTNGNSTYGADRWYVKNSLGTNGVITFSRATATSTDSRYAARVKITTAPTGSQANGCELYQTLDNAESLNLYNKTASFQVKVKALGNVNQVGIQFFYKTSEAKVDTALGSETTATVTTGSLTTITINGQALGTSATTTGVIGVRVRITGVSTGNTYDLNNGFEVEQALLNVASNIGDFRLRCNTLAEERLACMRYYEKSYPEGTDPASGSSESGMTSGYAQTTAILRLVNPRFLVPKRAGTTPTIVVYDYNGSSGKVSPLGSSSSIGTTLSISTNSDNGFNRIDDSGSGFTATTFYWFNWTAEAEV